VVAMRLLVVSDTHGNYQLLHRLLQSAGAFDLFIHAGDSGNDLLQLERDFPNLPRYAVAGNCDPFSRLPRELLFQVGGRRIFLTHGDRYGVKYDLLRLVLQGKENRADLVIFGHTHLPLVEASDGMLLLNPGSLSYSRGGGKHSYGWVEIGPGGINAEIRTLEQEKERG